MLSSPLQSYPLNFPMFTSTSYAAFAVSSGDMGGVNVAQHFLPHLPHTPRIRDTLFLVALHVAHAMHGTSIVRLSSC